MDIDIAPETKFSSRKEGATWICQTFDGPLKKTSSKIDHDNNHILIKEGESTVVGSNVHIYIDLHKNSKSIKKKN